MSLHRKVFLVTGGLIAVVFAAALALIHRQVGTAMAADAARCLTATDRGMGEMLREHTRAREQQARNVADDPLLVEAFARGDAASLEAVLAGLARELPYTEVLLAAGPAGVPLAVRGLGGTRLPASLAGTVPFSARPGSPRQGVWLVEGRLYQMVAAPVFDAAGARRLGTIGLGLRIEDEALARFQELTQSDQILLAGGRVAASSLPRRLAGALAPAAGELPPEEARRIDAAGSTYLARRRELPLAFGGAHYSQVVLRSLAGADALSGRILQGMLLVGLGAAALAFACAWLGARRISLPLRSLSSAMAEMARKGRLRPDFRTVGGEPEVRQIEESFRQLLVSLEESRRARERSYVEAVGAVVTAADARDHETTGHSFRVAHYAVLLAKGMGIRGEALKAIEWGSLLHDVGKMVVPDEILRKSGPLTEAEWHIMRQHPNWGFEMLAEVGFLQQPALEIVYSHHERWDGAGYPRRLAGEDIPLAARIFAVVDTYDAITSDRPYRKAHSHLAAINELKRVAGYQLDPNVVEVFCRIPEVELRRLRELCKRIYPGLSLPPDLLDAMTEPDTGELRLVEEGRGR